MLIWSELGRWGRKTSLLAKEQSKKKNGKSLTWGRHCCEVFQVLLGPWEGFVGNIEAGNNSQLC